jgi:hypothetical protein
LDGTLSLLAAGVSKTARVSKSSVHCCGWTGVGQSGAEEGKDAAAQASTHAAAALGTNAFDLSILTILGKHVIPWRAFVTSSS